MKLIWNFLAVSPSKRNFIMVMLYTVKIEKNQIVLTLTQLSRNSHATLTQLSHNSHITLT